jgi:hypothetical protein
MLSLDGDLGLECAVIGGIDQPLSTLSAEPIVILADSLCFEKFD